MKRLILSFTFLVNVSTRLRYAFVIYDMVRNPYFEVPNLSDIITIILSYDLPSASFQAFTCSLSSSRLIYYSLAAPIPSSNCKRALLIGVNAYGTA
jgi:hypothetical protein